MTTIAALNLPAGSYVLMSKAQIDTFNGGDIIDCDLVDGLGHKDQSFVQGGSSHQSQIITNNLVHHVRHRWNRIAAMPDVRWRRYLPGAIDGDQRQQREQLSLGPAPRAVEAAFASTDKDGTTDRLVGQRPPTGRPVGACERGLMPSASSR